ncbi:MAG: polysaccharide pyruvyl transferase family protein [Monoglobales bacterium]
MKIGILTFHRAINYGAVTQCYALVKRLQKDFPDDTVEVIDYSPTWRIASYKPTLAHFLFGNTKRNLSILGKLKAFLAKFIELILSPSHYFLLKKRYKSFQNSMDCLPLSKTSYRQDDPEEFRKAIFGTYDIIIVGSDCVWKWSTVPLPSPYYLYGDFGAVKACFAASAGTDDYAQLRKEDQQWLKNAIEKFSYIGLRDSATEYIVKNICPKSPYYHNCDPTTFLNIGSLDEYCERVREKMINAGIDFNKPVLCIMGNEKLWKLARKIFKSEVQYVGVYVPSKNADVYLADLPVLEWATVFGLCNLTFTTFFHGTMLSLVNNTPVLSFDYLPETEKQHTKLHELYDRLDLPGFYHRGKSEYGQRDVEEIGTVARRLLSDPPKREIAAAIAKEAEYYESFREFMKDLHENRTAKNEK